MIEKDDIFYIEQIRKGNAGAYAYLVNRYSNMVYSLVLKLLKNETDAEDLAQEVFIAAYGSLNSFKGNAKFSTWIYRIAYNKAISQLRKKNIEFSTENDLLLENNSEPIFQSPQTDEEEKINLLQAYIRLLSDEEQLLIMLHYFENQSIEDISLVTGLTEANVKVKLFRTRKKLKDQLEKTTGELVIS
jgi:RNA polymerase sigma-70 factor (ECF subfamily)